MRSYLAAGLLTALALQSAGAQPEKTLPLEPTRRLEFTTHEGSWLSIDVSPRTGEIVFDLLGDLYLLDAHGGSARRLTDGQPFDSQPRFSPDGARVCYLSDAGGAEQVWIMNADGSGRRPLTQGSRQLFASPAWTRDGRYIVVSRAQRLRAYELWMYHVDGGSGVQITKQAEQNALGAVASPDGRYLYYASRTGTATWNITLPLWQIERRDLLTGDRRTLTALPGSAMRPAISPDGRRLVYGTRLLNDTELRMRDLGEGSDVRLAYPVQHDEQEAAATRDLLPGYAFTPDGAAIVIAYGGGLKSIDTVTRVVRPIEFEADVSVPLGPALRFEPRNPFDRTSARLIESASESPDGAQVVFSAVGRLYLRGLPDGTTRRLTGGDDREHMPAWSPDGKWIVYVTWGERGGHVWRVDAAGGAPTRLTGTPAFYKDPAVSPRGDRIVFLQAASRARLEHEGGVYGPVAMTLAAVSSGGGPVEEIASGSGASRPHFSSDPDRVYFRTGEGLESVRLDGSDRRKEISILYHREPEPAQVDDIRIAPDRRRVLVENNSRLHVLPVPRAGTPITVHLNSPTVPVTKISDLGGTGINWAGDGTVATWSLGSSYFRARPGEEPVETRIDVPIARSTAAESLVLRGGRALTMDRDGVIEDADVIVTGNRIASVSRRGRARLPAGARIVDVRGATILPGFVDAHSHMAAATGLEGVRDVQPWPYLANLAYGVTTTFDPQPNTLDVFAYDDLMRAGRLVGPRLLTTGPGIFGGGFYSDVNLQTLDEARAIVRRYRDYYGVDTVKGYLVGDRRQRQLLAIACRELGVRLTAEGAGDTKLDLTHALDGFSGNEHNLPMFPLHVDVIRLFVGSGLWYTPTLISGYGGPEGANYFFVRDYGAEQAKLERFVPAAWLQRHTRRRPWVAESEHMIEGAARGAAALRRAGVLVGVGSHAKIEGLSFHWEMQALAQGGLTPDEILRAATIDGATIAGVEKWLGSITPGKLADLIVLRDDPRRDIRHSTSLRYVVKDGVLYDAATMTPLFKQLLEP
jgi:Tol biopolymer transport system component/imidazolonepropionase-like amidohydrolase